MPLDPLLVEATIKSGLSAVCATCTKYWRGREQGLPEPQCTATTKCGSPLASDDFHEYEGPLQQFERFCFVCAAPSKYGITVHGRVRVIGVCRTHITMLVNVQPTTEAPQAHKTIVKTDSGIETTPEQTVPKSKPSLFAAIAAAEKTFK